MRSIDVDLRKSLEFRPERGELLLSGERMVLFNPAVLRGLYQQLARDLGVQARRAFLMQLGQRWGSEDYETLSQRYEWDSDHDRLYAGPVTHMWEGIVHVETLTVEHDRGAGHFLMKGIWRNSFEVELHRDLVGAGKGDHCMCLAGYASGWCSAFFGQALLAVERTCISRGDAQCTFEIRDAAAFGAEADAFRDALSAKVARPAAARDDGAGMNFVANMSHELRTPVAAIIGLSQSLGQGALNPGQRRSLEMLRESADRLVTLVGNVVELAQLGGDEVEIDAYALDLGQLVDGLAAQLDGEARGKGLTFFVTRQDDFAPMIVADGERVKQVLARLFGNALKFTDAGAVVVTLQTPEPLPDGRLRYAIDVNDTGPGVAPERIADLFRPFARLQDPDNSPRGGSGLGLAVCRRMARVLGGDVELIESTLGCGSTFRFWFPAQPATSETTAPAAPTHNLGSVLDPLSLRILVVEDNPVLLFLLREQLGNLGFLPVAVPGGREALAELDRQPFDIIFTDLHMPRMDGFAFVRELRARPLSRQPYVVALTADTAPRIRTRALAEGMNDFAIKPLSQEALGEVMERLLSAGSSASAAQAAGNAPGGGDAIDDDALEALKTNLGSYELLADLIGTFIRDAHELIGLFASKNDVEARRAAHSLKSTAMTVGARSLASIAAEGERGQPATVIPRAKAELGRVEHALHERLGTRP